MLVRRDQRGVLAIGQPAHAWVCGQLARAWGNQRFGAVTPLEEVALGAEQHDLGMAQLDLDPPLDPETGLPRSFMDLPLDVHLSLWRAGPPKLVSQSRYAALLAAIHGRRLYELRDLDAALSAVGDRHRTLSLDPWPFAEPSILVRAEGRRLTETFAGQDELGLALASAPWETVELRLVPRPQDI